MKKIINLLLILLFTLLIIYFYCISRCCIINKYYITPLDNGNIEKSLRNSNDN